MTVDRSKGTRVKKRSKIAGRSRERACVLQESIFVTGGPLSKIVARNLSSPFSIFFRLTHWTQVAVQPVESFSYQHGPRYAVPLFMHEHLLGLRGCSEELEERLL